MSDSQENSTYDEFIRMTPYDQFAVLSRGREVIEGWFSVDDLADEDLGEWTEGFIREGNHTAIVHGTDYQITAAVLPGEKTLKVVSGFGLYAFLKDSGADSLGIRINLIKADDESELNDLRIKYGFCEGTTNLGFLLTLITQAWDCDEFTSSNPLSIANAAKLVVAHPTAQYMVITEEQAEAYKEWINHKTASWGIAPSVLWTLVIMPEQAPVELLANTQTSNDCNERGFMHLRQLKHIATKLFRMPTAQTELAKHAVLARLSGSATERLAEYLATRDEAALAVALSNLGDITDHQIIGRHTVKPGHKDYVEHNYLNQVDEPAAPETKAVESTSTDILTSRLTIVNPDRPVEQEPEKTSHPTYPQTLSDEDAAILLERIEKMAKPFQAIQQPVDPIIERGLRDADRAAITEHEGLEEIAKRIEATPQSLGAMQSRIDDYLDEVTEELIINLPPPGSFELRKLKQFLAEHADKRLGEHPERFRRFQEIQRLLNPEAFS